MSNNNEHKRDTELVEKIHDTLNFEALKRIHDSLNLEYQRLEKEHAELRGVNMVLEAEKRQWEQQKVPGQGRTYPEYHQTTFFPLYQKTGLSSSMDNLSCNPSCQVYGEVVLR